MSVLVRAICSMSGPEMNRSCRRLSSIGHPAAVDQHVDPADVGGLVGGKEGDGGRNVRWLTEPAEWCPRKYVRQRGIVLAQVAGGSGHDLAGSHSVADDAVAPMLHGDLAGHLHEATLADRVGEVAGRSDHAVL